MIIVVDLSLDSNKFCYKNLLLLILLLNSFRFLGSNRPKFYRVQNYCYFINPAIPIIMKKCTIIKHHSKECCKIEFTKYTNFKILFKV